MHGVTLNQEGLHSIWGATKCRSREAFLEHIGIM